MAESRNPFLDDICLATPGEPLGGSVSLFDEEIERILGAIRADSGSGGSRVVMLLAPRAGFGKTHLLNLLADKLAGEAVLINLRFSPEEPVAWGGLFGQILEAFEQPESVGKPETQLDIAVRYLLARANRLLIDSEIVPCSNRWEADSALAKDYVRLFDFSDPSQVVAKWFGANFHKIAPHAGRAIGAEAGVDDRACESWLASLCSYAESIGDCTADRGETLRWAAANRVSAAVTIEGMQLSAASGTGEDAAKRRVLQFCRLVTLHRPIAFLFDHLDSFYGDSETCLKIAHLVSELQRGLPRKLSILSLNEDVWDSSFRTALPSAFEDRLTGEVVNLSGISYPAATELVALRLHEAGISDDESKGYLRFLRLEDYFREQAGKLISPRTVLRYASLHWELFSNRRNQPEEPLASSEPPSCHGPTQECPVEPFLLHLEDESLVPDRGSSLLGGEIQDVIASAVDGLDVPKLVPAPVKAANALDETNPFQRLKGMLLKLREERSELDGVAHELPVHTTAPPLSSDDEIPDAADAGIIKAFNDARRRIETMFADGAEPPTIEVEKVRNLVRVAGQRFPVVSYEEFELPDAEGREVVKWAFGENEIYFGFEDESKEQFWLELAEFVGTRTALHSRNHPPGIRAKIVAFSGPGGESTYHSIRNGDTPWDVICLDRASLGALYAADEMINRAESGDLAAEPRQILGILASQLDFFWKRITRPKGIRAPIMPSS